MNQSQKQRLIEIERSKILKTQKPKFSAKNTKETGRQPQEDVNQQKTN